MRLAVVLFAFQLAPPAAGFPRQLPIGVRPPACFAPAAPRAEAFATFGGFGLDPRAMRRMSEMKRADEPLREELQGLCLLGAVGGSLLLAGSGNAFLGGVLGSQLAPLLSTADGAAGERSRAAGWEAWAAFLAARARAARAWRAADARFDLSGRWRRLDLPRRARRFDARFDCSGKARAAGRRAVELGSSLLALLERRGVTGKARRLWQRTGLPARWREFEQEQLLRARMRQLRDQEGGGF